MLSVLGLIYGKIITVRNALYDKGVFETFDLGAHSVSIGNITAGGTGKTPLVVYVARKLAARGETVCVLTRGYGRSDERKRVLVSDAVSILADSIDAGDEPVELAQKLVGEAIVIADADRVAAAEWAKRRFGITAFVLDDGFQHRQSKRDIDIVCIDATDPFGGGKMLPVGRLREPLANLARADAVVITRSDLVDDYEGIRAEIERLAPECPIYVARSETIGIVELTAFFASPDSPVNRKWIELGKQIAVQNTGNIPAAAFCALGNPRSFYDHLRSGIHFDAPPINLTSTRDFRDHHKYDQPDIEDIEQQARQAGAAVLLTTAKDAVKLRQLAFTMPCFVVEIAARIDDSAAFDAML